MEKPIYGFFISLFNVLLVWIVFANFLGWSGGAVNLTGVAVDWQNSYIGFSSLIQATGDFNNRYNSVDALSFKQVLSYSSDLINYVLLGIPQFISDIKNFNLAGLLLIVPVVKFFVTLLLQPILLLVNGALIIGCIFWFLFCFLTTFFMFIGGAYNIPYTDNSEIWSQWDYLSEIGRYVKVV